ncbi:MAG: DegT/DnrJ/EryC1/StrS family aminotransferase [Candidatus Bathyarchaeia archaeon]|jgi:dTDP-4-amino-4,6-dideoxygalactose transaminase
MSSDIIPPTKPYFPQQDIEEMKEHLVKILTSGQLTLGEYTRDFERQFANLTGVRRAIAVNSGTSALEIALRAHGLKKGDEVIVPTNTFTATAAAVVYAGGRPVMTDISPKTMTIDSNAVKQTITEKTRGVIPVHIGGIICPEIDAIREICSQRGLFLIEDAAHAHGSRIGGKPAGSLGLAGCFSFYPTKVITSGEGGMITTDSKDLADTADILRDQGKESYTSNRIVKLGYNWRMPEISAALGILQLRRLSEFIQKRNAIARTYDEGFSTLGLERVVTPANQLNNYYKYTFFLPKNVDRDKFKALCRERGVAFGGEVYWPPLHLQPAFREFLHEQARFDMAEEWGRRMVNPPMFSQMTGEQAGRVVDVSREVLSRIAS